MTSIAVDQLRLHIGGAEILHDVSMRCRPGRVTGLLGPNGSGKTTLLHTVAGLRRPSDGVVHVDGQDVRGQPPRERATTLALVEQHADTSLELTVRDVVELGRLPHRSFLAGATSDPAGASIVTEALKAVDVEHLAERRWGSLSGGERQRVHLARALAQRPQILLLDEPTNHLDLGHQLRFMSLVRSLGLTTLAAIHDLELAVAYCDDIVVLDGGQVVAAGPANDALTPELLEQVYGVAATIIPHPLHDRPHLVWHGPCGDLS